MLAKTSRPKEAASCSAVRPRCEGRRGPVASMPKLQLMSLTHSIACVNVNTRVGEEALYCVQRPGSRRLEERGPAVLQNISVCHHIETNGRRAGIRTRLIAFTSVEGRASRRLSVLTSPAATARCKYAGGTQTRKRTHGASNATKTGVRYLRPIASRRDWCMISLENGILNFSKSRLGERN